MRSRLIQKAGLALALVMVTGVANAIVRTYTDADGSGEVTFTELAGDQLQIDIDNTSPSPLSSIITGIVFDIADDISAMTVASFVDGGGADLSGDWTVGLNVNNNITPGNTVVDLSFTADLGINGGIYNTGVASNTNNAFPDVATLVLNVTSPTDWDLVSISNDILRMQRTGTNGSGSLKIPGGPGDDDDDDGPSGDDDDDDTPSEVPEPGILTLLGLGLAGIGVFRRRMKG